MLKILTLYDTSGFSVVKTILVQKSDLSHQRLYGWFGLSRRYIWKSHSLAKLTTSVYFSFVIIRTSFIWRCSQIRFASVKLFLFWWMKYCALNWLKLLCTISFISLTCVLPEMKFVRNLFCRVKNQGDGYSSVRYESSSFYTKHPIVQVIIKWRYTREAPIRPNLIRSIEKMLTSSKIILLGDVNAS